MITGLIQLFMLIAKRVNDGVSLWIISLVEIDKL